MSMRKTIIFFIHCTGTLMGYYWNGDMIPWDDDIDIMVSGSSFRAIKDNLWRNGERIDKTKQLYRNLPPNNPSIKE